MTHLVSGLLLAALLGAAPGDVERAPHDPRDDGQAAVDVSSYPAEQQRQYPIFLLKCSKCHPAARAINSRFNSSEWKRYMKKMIRRPNSGINEEQAADIYEFLKYYSGRQGGAK